MRLPLLPSPQFHPVLQFLYFDSIESMPSQELPAEEYEQQGSRCGDGGGGGGGEG